jgi:hypothetical protein
MRTWQYRLTAQEEAICVEVGYQRQKPYFGDPTKNVNYAEGDLWELWQHAICAGSELAFARMMGLNDFVPHFNKWKTELDIPGVGEVRYSFNSSGLRFTKRDNPDLKYILLVDGLAIKNRTENGREYKSTPYKAIGWFLGKDCMQDKYRSKYNNTSWLVPISQLRPMPN